MYNPSRGGVRGGADQFTWESVKSDKHRENYLGHSLMAPVGRWQKGKDLSWYAKERKEANTVDKSEESELASIKQAEEEAMLIALGHNIVRKTQTLSKEDIQKSLKRNTRGTDDHNIERVGGVGAPSQRVAVLSGVEKNSKQNTEGIAFESHKEKHSDVANKSERDFISEERKKSKRKSKKHKKERKHKKHHKDSYDSDSSDSDGRKSSKHKSHKKSKHKHRDSSSDHSGEKHHSNARQEDNKRHKRQSDFVKKRRYDTSESD